VLTAQQLRQRARVLYSRGETMAAIGDAVGRAESTIYRWRQQDADEGIDWSGLRRHVADLDRELIPTLIRQKITETLRDESLSPTQRADALLKLECALSRELARRGGGQEGGECES